MDHLVQILESTNVKNLEKVAFKMLIDTGEYINPILNKYNFSYTEPSVSIPLHGGGFIKEKYKFGKYVFTLFINNKTPSVTIYPNDNIESAITCLNILFDKEQKLAYIQNITYKSNCANIGLEYPGGGSILLKMAIKFLRENKQRFKIDIIQIKDNSYLSCANISKTIDLSSLYMLTSGDTWYGKYGFVPFDYIKGIDDTEKHIDYKVNKKLVNLIKLKCTNIANILLKGLNENNLETYINSDKFMKFCKKYENEAVMTFFKEFMKHKQFESTCPLFFYTYKNIFNDLGLVNLHGVSYYMKI